jgi:hypothetical protein
MAAMPGPCAALPSPLTESCTLPSLAGARQALEYLLRVAFGSALVASVAVVFLAITAIASSSQQNDSRERGGRGGNVYYGGPRAYIDLTDLLWYFDPFW